MSGKRSVFYCPVIVFCGLSTLAFLASCGGGGGSKSTPTQPSISVSVNPATLSLNGGGTQSFTATVANDSANAGVAWSIGSGVGTLSASTSTSVTYTVPPTVAAVTAVTLTASSKTDATKSASAAITLNPPPTPPTITSVSVSCIPTSVQTGQTSQCTAPVAGTGSYNSSVSWSASTGKVSSSGLFTAAATAGSATVTATSVQDSSKSGNTAVSVTASTSGIAITTVSTTTPTPLASLKIGTTGINASNAVTLNFSNSAGFSATEQAVRVQSDGTVIAGVPLYVDPRTGEIGKGTVSLVVSQGTQSSDSTSLTIQDLPPLSTYGTQLGQISHSFLIFEAMLHARRLNEFQAAQQLVGTSVDTSSAQTVMLDLRNASTQARTDVDKIMSNNGTLFSWGSINGTKLQFDSTQLDAMDRIIALYLTQQFPSSSSAAITSPISPRLTHTAQPEINFSSMGNLLTCIASNAGACFMQAQEAVQSSPNPTDTSTAWLTGMETTLKLGGAEQEAALPGLALGFTHISAGVDSLTHGISNAVNCLGSPIVCSPGDQQSILGELNSAGAAIVSSITQTISQVPVLLEMKAEQQAANIISEGMGSLSKIVDDSHSGAIAAADTTSVSLVSSPALSQLSGKMGYVTGTAENTASPGNSAPQSSLGLCCFGASKLGITALADPDGNYDLLVPIGVAGTNYSALSLSEVDPATFITLATETVNLSDLSATASVTAPILIPLTVPTSPPYPGTYAGSCNAQTSSITCCWSGVCSTVAGASATSPFNFTLLSGTSLSQFTSSVCSKVEPVLLQVGCASASCGFAASTSTSATFNLSCRLPVVEGCTVETATEVCTATQQ